MIIVYFLVNRKKLNNIISSNFLWNILVLWSHIYICIYRERNYANSGTWLHNSTQKVPKNDWKGRCCLSDHLSVMYISLCQNTLLHNLPLKPSHWLRCAGGVRTRVLLMHLLKPPFTLLCDAGSAFSKSCFCFATSPFGFCIAGREKGLATSSLPAGLLILVVAVASSFLFLPALREKPSSDLPWRYQH